MSKFCIIMVNYFSADIASNICKIGQRYNLDCVIVDNSVCNKQVESLVEMSKGFANVYIFASDENVGFGRGCQLGIDFALTVRGYDAFLFINPDISEINLVELPNSLNRFMQDNDSAYFQPLIFDDRGENSVLGVTTSNNFKVVLLYSIVKFIIPILKKHVLRIAQVRSKNTQIYIPSGAFVVVKSSVLRQIGGFPKDNFLYFEEWLLAHRIFRIGLHGYVDEKLTVYHLLGYSTGLHYSIGNKRMLIHRKYAFLNANKIINDNIILKYISVIIIYMDYFARLVISEIKK